MKARERFICCFYPLLRCAAVLVGGTALSLFPQSAWRTSFNAVYGRLNMSSWRLSFWHWQFIACLTVCAERDCGITDAVRCLGRSAH